MSSLKFSLGSYLGRHPSLFSLYYRNRKEFSALVVAPESEIVIEGFPRCANSFAVLALERAQGRRLRIAHHLHAQSQIVLGVEYGIPMVVLIREPVGAVASLLTRHENISVGQALDQYARFYRCVEAYAQQLVVAEFRTITSDYARVINAVNRRFGTNFNLYRNSPKEDGEIFTEIDRLNAAKEGGRLNQLARPSLGKSELLARAAVRVEAHRLLHEARAVFRALESRFV